MNNQKVERWGDSTNTGLSGVAARAGLQTSTMHLQETGLVKDPAVSFITLLSEVQPWSMGDDYMSFGKSSDVNRLEEQLNRYNFNTRRLRDAQGQP